MAAPTAVRPGGEARLNLFVRAALWIALLALVLPVTVASVPPLLDYPNHLARIWLLAGGAGTPPVSGMYRVTWDTLTNIGIDLLAVLMAKVVGYEAIGRSFVTAAAILPAVGGVALWRVLHGRFHWWQLVFAVLAWGMGLLSGFMNFEIGLGLALLAAAADPVLQRHGAFGLAIGRLVAAAALLLMHVFALVFYGVLLCGIALGPDFNRFTRRGDLLKIVRLLLIVAATLAAPILVLLLLGPKLSSTAGAGTLASAWTDFQIGFAHSRSEPISKLMDGFAFIRGYSNGLDGLALAVIAAPVVVSLALGRLSLHAGMLVAALGLVVCYGVFPSTLAATDAIDLRFAFMAPLALAAALRPELPARPALVAATALFAVALLRTGLAGWVWHQRQADVAALTRALAAVPPGAAVLPLEHQVDGDRGGPPGRFTTTHAPSYRHLPTLALPLRQAFVPTLFAYRGKQPIMVLPPWDAISNPNGGYPPDVRALTDPGIAAASLAGAPYLAAWRTRFDFALVLNADMPDRNGPFVLPAELEPVSDEGFAQLYRIRH